MFKHYFLLIFVKRDPDRYFLRICLQTSFWKIAIFSDLRVMKFFFYLLDYGIHWSEKLGFQQKIKEI